MTPEDQAHLRRIQEIKAREAEERDQKLRRDFGTVTSPGFLFASVKLHAAYATCNHEPSDKELSAMILHGYKQGFKSLHFYDSGFKAIDSKLTTRATILLERMKAPGGIIEGAQMSVSPIKMRELEPTHWNPFGLGDALKALENRTGDFRNSREAKKTNREARAYVS